jgi:two-component system, NarL family, nitrate/nitrite response regulator NarL
MTAAPDALRVLIVEDDRRYRHSLEALVGNTPGLALAGSFGAPLPALAWAERPGPAFDVALLDIELPHVTGIELVRRLRPLAPRAALVMLTVFEEPQTILEAICAGADGYLLKIASARELVAQIRAAAAGGAPMTASVARSVLEITRRIGAREATGAAPARLELTAREQDVLRAFVRGLSYQQVADDLGVSIDTVRTHVRALYRKLQVHSVAAAVAKAIRDRLV